MWRIRAASLIIGLPFLAGCTSSTTAQTVSGVLTGGIYICGGVTARGCPGVITAGVPARPIPGTVVVSLSGHTVATARLRDGESYRFSLRPGNYTVSAKSLGSGVRAVVKAGRTTTANVVEQIV